MADTVLAIFVTVQKPLRLLVYTWYTIFSIQFSIHLWIQFSIHFGMKLKSGNKKRLLFCFDHKTNIKC